MGNGRLLYTFKQHAVEDSSLHSRKIYATSFSVLLGLYYLLSPATSMLLLPTDGRVTTCVAWSHCMCIACGYRCNFFTDGYK